MHPTAATLRLATALEKHLENVVGVHAVTTVPASLINFLEVRSLIVHLLLLGVREDLVAFAKLFEHVFGLLLFLLGLSGVLVGMPNDCFFLVSLLDFWLRGILSNA